MDFVLNPKAYNISHYTDGIGWTPWARWGTSPWSTTSSGGGPPPKDGAERITGV